MMRVLQLGPYPPPHGGVQTNIVAIRQFLRERRIPCAVINLTRFRKAEADEVYYPASALQLIKLLLTLRYDIVHLHIGGSLTLRLLALGLVCCMMPRSRAVLTFHSGGYPSSEEGRTARPRTLRGFVFRRFDALVGVNSQIVEMFHQFGVPARRTHLILPHAFPAATVDASLPSHLKEFADAHQPLLLTVGLLEPEYDLPIQIEALGLIRQSHPNAGLMIIGSGSLERELRERIDSVPDAEHILLCGDIAHPVTMRMIAECGLFLRTTLYDGDSISVREALHVGTPVIATDNRMRPAGVTLIPPSDLAALCRAAEQQLAVRPTRHQQLDGDGEQNLQATLELYQSLI